MTKSLIQGLEEKGFKFYGVGIGEPQDNMQSFEEEIAKGNLLTYEMVRLEQLTKEESKKLLNGDKSYTHVIYTLE
jgi:hypothetical protein